DVGRDVLVDPGPPTDKGIGTDSDELVNRIQPAQHRTIVYGDVAGALSSIGNDNLISHMAVMSEMHVRHNEAACADDGLEGGGSATVDGGILPDDGPRSHLDPGFLSGELEILRVTTHDRAVADAHLLRQSDIALQPCPGPDATAISDAHLDRKSTRLNSS